MSSAVKINQADVAEARWDDPVRGSLVWKTLFSSGTTDTDSLTCGIAIMRAGDNFALHSHHQPEVYFGLEGTIDVQIGTQMHRLSPGVAMFIPGGAVHGVPHAAGDARWFYCFAVDSFDQVTYAFSPAAIQRAP